MRILHIINNIDRGGAETLLLNIIDKLQQRDSSYEISVLILEDKQYLRPQFDTAGIKVECVDCLSKSYFKQLFLIWRFIRSYKPDLVHTHLLKTDWVAQPAALFAGVSKRVCTVHNMELNRGKKDRLIRIITSFCATKLIAVSNSAKNFCIENQLYNTEKLLTIYNAAGFEVADVVPKTYPKGTFNIVNVARLHEQKGQKFLLEAMKMLQDSGANVHLTIYGTGPLEAQLNEQVLSLKLENTTVFGITNDVPKVLQEADLFVAPSLWEGLPLSQIEAIMIGVPVVATAIEPHKEIFNDAGNYTYLVKSGSSSEIAQKIKEIVQLDPADFSSLSEHMIKLSERFSMDTMVDKYDNFYRELLNA